MKPRTNLQKKVAELAKQLPALTEEQRRWAEDKCFEKTGYLVRKNRVWCHECGTEFNAEIPPLGADLDCAYAICPVCGKRIKVTNCKKHEHEEETYFTILTTAGGMQVCRHFEINKYSRRGRGAVHYGVQEVVQNWITDKGREVIMARSMAAFSYYYSFTWTTPLTLKTARSFYDDMSRYYINAYTYPKRQILPILRRNGYNARFQGMAPNEIFKYLLTDSFFETLVKAGRYKFAEYRYRHGGAERFMKLAIRHGYYPKDVDMWFDYIDMGEKLGMDMGNVKILCPKDLKEVHDEVMAKTEKKRKKEYKEYQRRLHLKQYAKVVRLAKEHGYKPKNIDMWLDYIKLMDDAGMDYMKVEKACPKDLRSEYDTLKSDIKRRQEEKITAEAEKWEAMYKEQKAKYFGLCFGDNRLKVSVINSVAEMAAEGRAMHHCVYNAEYFKKPESLILSAKNNKGERVETIEVNLKTYDVVQSRGDHNKNTRYHKRIISLVKKNMNLIRQAV